MGRASRMEKGESRARIVDSAARLFRERGLDGASVADVMKDAGLTHGGFYKHFANKNALVASAIDAAFDQITAPLDYGLEHGSAVEAGRAFRDFYLSTDHLANPGLGCPAAALSGEIGRSAQEIRHRFTVGVRTMLSALARTKAGGEREREIAAAQDLAMMVGAMTIARASDPSVAALMLEACGEPA